MDANLDSWCQHPLRMPQMCWINDRPIGAKIDRSSVFETSNSRSLRMINDLDCRMRVHGKIVMHFCPPPADKPQWIEPELFDGCECRTICGGDEIGFHEDNQILARTYQQPKNGTNSRILAVVENAGIRLFFRS